jgi:hypothetical protein
MIDRRTLDPVGSILQFRRIVDWMARVPEGSLKVQTVCSHMCSEHMLQTLDVDLICLYVVDTNNRSKVSKYTVRSEVGEILTYNKSNSILAEVINTGKVLKYSDLKSSPFDLKIDGCPGVIVKNILSVPLKNETTGTLLGAIHLINKTGGKIGFTELDETFASYYALSASTSLLGCIKFQHAKYRSSILTSILTSTSAIVSLVPRRDDIFMRDVNIKELLSVLENSCQIALHCFKVKAFLVTDHLLGMPSGYTLYAPERRRHSPKLKRDSTPHLEHARCNLGDLLYFCFFPYAVK